MSLRQLIRLYVSWTNRKVQSGKLERSTAKYYAGYHRRFLLFVGDVDVGTLKRHHLTRFSESRNAIQAIRRLFNWALDAEHLNRNPFRRVKLPPAGERKRIMTRFEEVTLLRAANRQLRELGMLMSESLARPQEARILSMSDLHTHSSGVRYFRLDDFKGLRRRKDQSAIRVIPITGRLDRMLTRLRRRHPRRFGPILRNTEGQPWTKDALRQGMQYLREAVGLGPDRRGENIVAYTFRHTSATRAALKGIRDRILAELMGHASTRTTARYQHLEVTDLLPGFLSAMAPPARQVRRR